MFCKKRRSSFLLRILTRRTRAIAKKDERHTSYARESFSLNYRNEIFQRFIFQDTIRNQCVVWFPWTLVWYANYTYVTDMSFKTTQLQLCTFLFTEVTMGCLSQWMHDVAMDAKDWNVQCTTMQCTQKFQNTRMLLCLLSNLHGFETFLVGGTPNLRQAFVSFCYLLFNNSNTWNSKD